MVIKMYFNGQIVYDIDNKKPHKVGDESGSSFAWSNLPKNNTHFIDLGLKKSDLIKKIPKNLNLKSRRIMGLNIKKSNVWVGVGYTIKQAQKLMDEGKIKPFRYD